MAEGAWVHAEQPTPQELDELIAAHHLDANVVRDVNDTNELPRSELSHSSLYVFLRTAQHSRGGEVTTVPFLVVMAPHSFITVAGHQSLQATDIVKAGNGAALRTAHRGAMLILVLNTIVSQYEVLMQQADRYITSIRHKLQSHEVGNKDFVRFVTVEDNLNEYQASLQNTLAVVERLKENTHNLFTKRDIEDLDDTALYIRQLLSAVTSYGQSITSIRNAYSTIANNTLNMRMKTLTVFTVLIALPNVFYGMYGMNVPLPFQESPWAYSFIVLFTLLVIFIVYTLAKRYRIF